MTEGTDLVSAELRAAEKEVDGAFLSNPLIRQPLTVAHWHTLAFLEERALKRAIKDRSANGAKEAAFADSLVVNLKWPMLWLQRNCEPGGAIPTKFNNDLYDAAWKLSEFSPIYTGYETAFTYASMGLATLALDNKKITVSGPIREDAVYEAYDRLVIRDRELVLTDSPAALSYLQEVSQLVRVSGDRFSYRVEPRMFMRGLDAFDSILSQKFSLPGQWEFQGFSMADFTKVAKALSLLCSVHFWARLTAAANGCVGLGILDGILLMSPRELSTRLRRYTGVSDVSIENILRTMTYGEMQQKNPDPALQPIVRLGDTFGISPNLVMNSSMERNFAVLLNRVPEYRDDYSRLSEGRETAMRQGMEVKFEALGLRCWHGTVPDWTGAGQIDLVVEDQAANVCLVMELKSFIEPAEPREVKDKSEEIKRGIEQIVARRDCLKAHKEAFLKTSGVSDKAKIYFAVVSETSIGAVFVQDASVPVVRASHLLGKIVSDGLENTCLWLDNRAYLPKEGAHFKVVPVTLSAAGWELEFYGIDPLVDVLN